MNELQKEIRRLTNLKQNKKKDKSIIEQLAQINLWKKQINISSKFQDSDQQKLAEQMFDAYLANYTFENYTDVTHVANLVYEEILEKSIQKEIDKIVTDENTKYVPDKLIQSLHSVQSRVWELKEKAGIVGKHEQDDLTALEELKKRYKVHIAFNRNEFTFWAPEKCKSCGSENVQPVLIRRRCNKENFEILKHPFFSGRFYYNRRGMELIKAGLWTKEQYAWVFQTSTRYVEWCLENENKIIEIDEVEEQEIQEFINSRDYLKKEKIPENILKDK